MLLVVVIVAPTNFMALLLVLGWAWLSYRINAADADMEWSMNVISFPFQSICLPDLLPPMAGSSAGTGHPAGARQAT